MSNGYLLIQSCTVVENQVHGVARTNELGKCNLAGGIAATIGNAHAVESMTVGHSIVTGNTVHESAGTVYDHDIFTGSLFQFISEGHNRIGNIDFSQILVPVGERYWYSLCRKHYPKQGDLDGVGLADVLALSYGVICSPEILSAGVSAPNPAILYYIPGGDALDQVPPSAYSLNRTYAEYRMPDGTTDNFLDIMLGRLENHYGLNDFKTSFTADFEAFLASIDTDAETPGNQPYTDPGGIPILSLTNTLWYGPSATWPSMLYNYPYIEFWHRLDKALQAESIPGMGPELLGDDAWMALFQPGGLIENPDITFSIWTTAYSAQLAELDQLGGNRPDNDPGDIGAIEYIPPALPGLTLDDIIDGGSNVLLHWSSAPDRTYSLWAASELSTNTWGLVESGITSTVPFNVYTTDTRPDNRFFKVEVE